MGHSRCIGGNEATAQALAAARAQQNTATQATQNESEDIRVDIYEGDSTPQQKLQQVTTQKPAPKIYSVGIGHARTSIGSFDDD